LLRGRLRAHSRARVLLGALTLAALLLALRSTAAVGFPIVLVAFGCAAASELIGRYLFYVTVVPMRGPGRHAVRRP
jgi:hypothetical protein